MGNLIDCNINQKEKLLKIRLEINIIPPDIKERLISYLNSNDDLGKIIDADCQIIVEGVMKDEWDK